MKTMLGMISVVAWVAVSLAVVTVVGRYRQKRARVGGFADRNEFRGERDMVLQGIVLLIGVLSAIVIYGLGRIVG